MSFEAFGLANFGTVQLLPAELKIKNIHAFSRFIKQCNETAHKKTKWTSSLSSSAIIIVIIL